MSKRRIYVVGADERLVRAGNVVQARNHVARHTIQARLASQEDLVRLLSNGARSIEDASGDADDVELG